MATIYSPMRTNSLVN